MKAHGKENKRSEPIRNQDKSGIRRSGRNQSEQHSVEHKEFECGGVLVEPRSNGPNHHQAKRKSCEKGTVELVQRDYCQQ